MGFLREEIPVILLLIISESFIGVKSLKSILPDVTYQEIESLNATCEGFDSCQFSRMKDTPENYNCNCGSFCSLLGTCCVDAQHKQKFPEPLKNVQCEKYLAKYDNQIYFYPMIRSCNPDLKNDEMTERLCNSKGEELNDPFLLIPVTDPIIGISYKNYYCHACNKHYSEEQPILWNLEVFSESKDIQYFSVSNLHYDASKYRWVMDYGQNNATVVRLDTYIPDTLKTDMQFCFNSKIISECASDWSDDNIRDMCLAYMALTRIPKVNGDLNYTEYYRNPHCAICNYQSIETRVCEGEKTIFNGGGNSRDSFVGLSNPQGDRSMCLYDNMVYDPIANRCRELRRVNGGGSLVVSPVSPNPQGDREAYLKTFVLNPSVFNMPFTRNGKK